MSSLVFNGVELGEFCRAKTVEITPLVDGGLRFKVKLLLDTKAKMDVRTASWLRHRLNSLLKVQGATLVLPEEPEVEYRGVKLVSAQPWEDLLICGSVVVEFECADGVAYGKQRVSSGTDIEVGGTAATYPVIEVTAAAGDSVMVLDVARERFVQVIHTFAGGEKVCMDFEQEQVEIDGVEANCDIGMYSDFFALVPGVNALSFAGCSSHSVMYTERWL